MGIKIKDIPVLYRPREKAIYHGINTLNDYELLAILIGSGIKDCSAIEIAINLLKTYFSLNNLATIDYQELIKFRGLSKATALRLVVAFDLAKRLLQKEKCFKYFCAEELAKHYQYLNNEQSEILLLLILNQNNEIIKEKVLARGTKDAVLINQQQIIKEILLAEAKRFIIIHNHLVKAYPSEDDIVVTSALKNIAKKFNMTMIDHLIISPHSYYSFKENKTFEKV